MILNNVWLTFIEFHKIEKKYVFYDGSLSTDNNNIK